MQSTKYKVQTAKMWKCENVKCKMWNIEYKMQSAKCKVQSANCKNDY